MTLPDERYRSLAQVPDRLYRLAMAPGPIRKGDLAREVSAILRHYPSKSELDRLTQASPELLEGPK